MLIGNLPSTVGVPPDPVTVTNYGINDADVIITWLTRSSTVTMEGILPFLTILSLFLVTGFAEQSTDRGFFFQGQDLRLYELYETTSWPFLEDCYNSHNAYRRMRDTQELKMNRTLVDYARLKALIYAWYDGDAPKEKDPPMFGENVYWTNTDQVDCSDAVRYWMEEERDWNYEEPQVRENNHQFAQVVWRGSQRFGCGQSFSRGPKGGTYTVCFYDPTVNSGGELENVPRTRTRQPSTTTAAPSNDVAESGSNEIIF